MTTLRSTRTETGRSSLRRGGTMLAAAITAPREARIVERPLPEPGPGQVRVRLLGCGICGSNIPVWEGREWFQYPREPGAPGHEGWGVVDALGEGVRSVEPGDHVALLSYHAFAEYDVADAAAVIPLPPELRGRPMPGEALGCAMNVMRRSGVESAMNVAVVGVGFLGALLVQLAAGAGARVVAVGRRPCSLEIARSMGASASLPFADDRSPVVEQVKQMTDGRLCDVVIEAAGAQSTLDLSTDLTRERGRLVIAGYHQDGRRGVDMQLWNWRGLDVINAHERDAAVYIDGMRSAAEAVASGRLDPAPLYTHEFPLERIADALETACARPEGFMKAIVRIGTDEAPS